MSVNSVILEVSESELAVIDEIAANREIDRADVLREAVATYLADYAHLQADLDEADRKMEAGEYITHEEVVARFEAKVRGLAAA